MKIRLLYTLLVAALVATAALALGGLPATAEMRTIMVRLDTGELVPVQVDVPPGTPLEDIEIPDLPGGADEPADEPSTPEPTDTPDVGTPKSTEQDEQESSRSKERAKKDKGDEEEEIEEPEVDPQL